MRSRERERVGDENFGKQASGRDKHHNSVACAFNSFLPRLTVAIVAGCGRDESAQAAATQEEFRRTRSKEIRKAKKRRKKERKRRSKREPLAVDEISEGETNERRNTFYKALSLSLLAHLHPPPLKGSRTRTGRSRGCHPPKPRLLLRSRPSRAARAGPGRHRLSG